MEIFKNKSEIEQAIIIRQKIDEYKEAAETFKKLNTLYSNLEDKLFKEATFISDNTKKECDGDVDEWNVRASESELNMFQDTVDKAFESESGLVFDDVDSKFKTIKIDLVEILSNKIFNFNTSVAKKHELHIILRLDEIIEKVLKSFSKLNI